MCTVIRIMLCVWCCIPLAASAAEDVVERAVPGPMSPLQQSLQRSGNQLTDPAIEQQVAVLQQQIHVLQAQVEALQSVLKVTSAGATLQGPSIALISSGDVTIKAGGGIAVHSGAGTSIKAGTFGSLEASGTVDVRGSQVRFNGGNRPIATVGSLVQVQGQPNGQIITGNPSIVGN